MNEAARHGNETQKTLEQKAAEAPFGEIAIILPLGKERTYVDLKGEKAKRAYEKLNGIELHGFVVLQMARYLGERNIPRSKTCWILFSTNILLILISWIDSKSIVNRKDCEPQTNS